VEQSFQNKKCMSKLQNKVAVVTGGNSGIGYATAQELINQGARVVITGRDQKAIDEATGSLGNGTVGFVSDQANLQHIDALVEKVKTRSAPLTSCLLMPVLLLWLLLNIFQKSSLIRTWM
jgi:NAD(P)-dependent dehydrogenase (short-subunit alcohol dehydrogenase family)